MGNNEELNHNLEIIKKRMNEVTRSPKDDFIEDYQNFNDILYYEYKDIDLFFWKYFKSKYKLPEISIYYSDPYELIKDVFNKCVHPYYLRLDILPFYDEKYELEAKTYYKQWKNNRDKESKTLRNVSIIILVISFVFAGMLREKYVFLYDVLMSIGTGFLITLLFSFFNQRHYRNIKKNKIELSELKYGMNWLKDKIEAVDIKSKSGELSNKDLMFLVMKTENTINSFIRRYNDLLAFKTTKFFHKFKETERTMFQYTGKIVRSNPLSFEYEELTEEEIGQLYSYLIQVTRMMKRFENEVNKLIRNFDGTIDEMESKSL